MSELIPAEEHETFSRRQDRRVVTTVLWRRDPIVGIVVVQRRDRRSALIPVPEFAQANAGARVQSGDAFAGFGAA